MNAIITGPAGGAGSAQGVTPAILRTEERLRIVHISDLHILQGTRFADSPWQPLKDSVAELQPDLIVATGDIADNPFSEFLANQRNNGITRTGVWWRVQWADWNTVLEDVLTRSREYLEDLCRSAGLDPSQRLLVIPGNHDYRAQGLFYGREVAADVFRKVFAGVNSDTIFEWRERSASPAILRTPIYCLDSNGPDEFSNFAAGRVEDHELQRIKRLNGSKAGLDEFRVVLMHHHPMPIAELEFTQKSFWRRLTGVTEDDRFLMLRNAGTVMRHLTAAGIHLVLHGHRHHRGYAQVAFPQMGDTEESSHRMTIVAAGSLGMGPANTHHFNVVDILPPGGIQVDEWKLEGVDFVRQATRVLVDEDSLRTERWKQARARHSGETHALADVIHERVEVTPAGDGLFRRTYRGLRSKDGARPLKDIPFTFASNSGYVHPNQRPRVQVLGGGDRTGRFEVDPEPAHAQTDVLPFARVVGKVVFEPPVPAGQRVDVEINFVLANVYEIVSDFLNAQHPECAGNEHVEFNVRRVPCEKLLLVVKRPVEMDAWRCDWSARVLGPDKRDDWQERRSSSVQTCAVEGSGLFVLTVRNPLSGYNYRVLWKLPTLRDVQRKLPGDLAYDEEALRKALAQPENRPKIAEALRRTRRALDAEMAAHFNKRRFAADTVLVFFRFDSTAMNLERVIDSANSEEQWILNSGEGIPGQALRRCTPVAYSPHGSAEDPFYYKMPPYQNQGHHFQLAMPVPYPPIFQEDKSYPMLGVLTLESVDADRTLLSLVSGGHGTQGIGATDKDEVAAARAVQSARGAVSNWTVKRFVTELATQLGVPITIK